MASDAYLSPPAASRFMDSFKNLSAV